MATEAAMTPASQEEVIWSACAHHCGGSCLLKVHVRDGVITRIEADDGDEPQLRGCLKGHALRQQVYAPDRLKYPLKRVGPRGAGQFERISWDEALDTIASELRRVKETYGNSAILLTAGGGNVTLVHGMGTIMERLLNMFGGYSGCWGWASWEAATFAAVANYGQWNATHSRDDLLNSRLIILWGVNPVDTIHSTNTTWYLAQAREGGTKIISIDPRYTATAATFAQQWIPIRPSTDTAMLVAMAYVMIREGLQDQPFLDRYTVGFDRFRDYVLGIEDGIAKTPAWAEQHTGVPAATIEQVARDYATVKPAALISGISAGRTAYGEQFHRATATLAAMTGNIGIHGGEPAVRSLGDQAPFNFYPFKPGQRMDPLGSWVGGATAGGNPVDREAPTRHITLRNYNVPRSYARIHYQKLPDAILKGKAGGYHADYKILISFNTCSLNQYANTNKWVEALNKLEFFLVFEQFMNPNAQYADMVLPTTTIFERNDLVVGGARPFYGFLKKVIEPMYECKSHLEIGELLAERLGIEDFNDKTDEEWVKQIATGGGDVPDWEEFKERAIYRIPMKGPYVAFKKQIEDPENNPFPTPSGKIEIYSQLLAGMDDPLIPPIPKYIEAWEGRNDPLAKKYPLQLITSRLRRRTHTQFETLPWLRERQPMRVMLNTDDARARGINDGDMVRVFNDRGVVQLPAEVTERTMPGVIDLPQGAWFFPDENGVDIGGCANTLCRDEHSPAGAFPYNTGLVQVEKA